MRGMMRSVARAIGSGAAQLTIAAAVVGLAAGPAAAQSVENEMNSFFNKAGGAANVTGPSAYKGQQAGYYSGGSIWARYPTKTVNPFNLQLPSARGGCGGIDLFSGSFSFINADEYVALAKGVANNAVGFAFQLAIDSISAMIGNNIKDMIHKVQSLNQFNMNSCEMAQQAVGSLWPAMAGASSTICQTLGNRKGRWADAARSRHGCSTGGEGEEYLAESSGEPEADVVAPRNYTWHSLMSQKVTPPTEYAEFLMTMVGTIIYLPAKTTLNPGEAPKFDFRPPAPLDVYTALLDGTGSSATKPKILKCTGGYDANACLTVDEQELSISEAASFRARVRTNVNSMRAKIRTNEALSGEEISLLGMASIPLYKILVVNEAAAFRIADSDMNVLVEIVAVDLLTAQIEEMLNEIQRSQVGAQTVEAEEYLAWRQRVNEVRTLLNDRKQEMAAKFANTIHIIERTQHLERTLKNAMSPQMTAALRFGRGLSPQGIR